MAASLTAAPAADASTWITSGPADGSFSNSSSATFSFATDSGDAFACSLDDPTWNVPTYDWVYPCPPPKTWSGLSDGQHTFRVTSGFSWEYPLEPPRGGWDFGTAASRTWTVDTVVPTTTITSGPANGSYLNNPQVSFSFSSNEPAASFECSLDAGAWAACSSPQAYTLADGSHTFKVRAKDPATNVDATPEQRSFTVDTVTPNTSITCGPTEGEDVNTVPVTFCFSATEASKFTCQLIGPTNIGPETCHAGFVTSATRSYSGLQAGNYTFRVFATDRATNPDATPAQRSFTYTPPSGLCDTPTATIYDGYAGTSYVNLRVQRDPNQTNVCVRLDNRQGTAFGGALEIPDPSVGPVGTPRTDGNGGACRAAGGTGQGGEIGNPGDPGYVKFDISSASVPGEVWVCVTVEGAVPFSQRVIVPIPGASVSVPTFTQDAPGINSPAPSLPPSGYPSARCEETPGGTKDPIINGDTPAGHLYAYERRTSNTAALCVRLAGGPVTLGGELKVDASGSLIPPVIGTDTNTASCTSNVIALGPPADVVITRSPGTNPASICFQRGSVKQRIWVDPAGIGTGIVGFTPDPDIGI